MDPLRDERFHLATPDRLRFVAASGAFVGAGLGFYAGIKQASMRYLTENAHRLPKTVGGWYFYHKKKNYVMIMGGLRGAVLLAARYSAAVAAFFAAEALFDKVRRTRDLFSTAAAAAAGAWGYGAYRHMSTVQTVGYVRRGAVVGLGLGLVQDAMVHARGGHVWYLTRPTPRGT